MTKIKVWWAWVILVIGLLFTIYATIFIKNDIDKIAKIEFNLESQQISHKIIARLHAHAQILKSGAALFNISNSVSRKEFKDFIDQSNIDLPGIQGICYSIIIPKNDLQQHINKIRSEGFPNYKIYPNNNRENYTSIIYLEPFSESNKLAFGYDMMTESVRREAMERARDLNAPALSGKVLLVLETTTDTQAGNLMYVPVYKKGAIIKTIEQRRNAIVGWVYSPYRMNDLMLGIMEEWNMTVASKTSMHIFDGKELSSKSLLFEYHTPFTENNSENIRFSNKIPIKFNGHQWTIVFNQEVGQGISDYLGVWIVFLSGIVISILLFFLAKSLININYKAKSIAENLNIELKESEKLLKESQRIASLGNFSTNITTGTWKSSAIFDEIFGIDVNYNRTAKGWNALIHNEYKTLMKDYFKENLINNTKTFNKDFKIIKNNNAEVRWVQAQGKIEFDSKNVPVKLIGTIIDITNRKLAEENLYVSREQYRSLFENSPLGIYQTKPNGVIIRANPSLLKMLEFDSLTELQKRDLSKQGYSKNSAINRKQFSNRIEKDGFVKGLEESWETKSGKEIPIRENARVIRGNTGEILFYEGTVEDITEQKKAEKKIKDLNENLEVIVNERTLELQQTKNRLEYLLTSAPVVIYTLTAKPPYKITYVGDNIKQMTGYKPEQLLENATFWKSKIHPEDKTQVFEKMSHLINTGHHTIEYQFLQNDGTYRWIHDEQLIIKDDKDNITEILGYWLDITERKKSEVKIQETLKEISDYKIALDESNIVAITDQKGVINHVNNNFCEISKYQRHELIGQDHQIINSGYHSKEFFSQLWNTIASGQIWKGEIKNKAKDGSFYWVDTTIVPFLNAHGKPYQYVAIRSDITSKKIIAEDLIKSKEAADSANRAKSEFLANMSHEIRTPMNAVIGFSELLYNSINDEKKRSQIESIRNSGKTLLKIINDILDLSKIESGKLILQRETVNIHKLVKDMQMIFTHKTEEKNVSFYIETENEIPSALLLDETRLRQILFNVLGNAVKFTEKGHIILTLEATNKTNDKIDLIIKVEDSGIGIQKNQQEKIFEAFSQQEDQINSKYGGTGLGLSITKRLVEIKGGKISVISKPGEGSIFTIHLPNIKIGNIKNLDSEKITFNPSSVTFKEAKILIVDNNKSNRNLIIDLLKNSPLTVFEAENGEEAVKIASKHIPDLILMDLRMPIMTGYEALNILKTQKSTKSIPVIAISASIKILSKTNELNENFDDLLMKPINLEQLILLIKKYLKYETSNPFENFSNKAPLEIEQKLSFEQKEYLPKLIYILENEFMPIYTKVVKNQMIDHIEKFGKDLVLLAEKNDFKIILNYGNEISKLADNFEIDKLIKTLKEFPQIIEQYKSLITPA